MPQDFEKLFASLDRLNPPAGLLEKILFRIGQETTLQKMRRRFIGFSLALIGSMGALIFTFKNAQTSFTESGFLNFFSLLFTDTGLVFSYLKNFLLTLLESLPIWSAAAFLIAVWLCLESLKFVAKYAKIVLIHKPIIQH